MRSFRNILVTGGYGFIASNFIRFIFDKSGYEGRVINADKITYAANPKSLENIEKCNNNERYVFSKVDIAAEDDVKKLFERYSIDCVINFAAETHVDRSINNPYEFIKTNVNGTYTLLEAAKNFWSGDPHTLFHQVSTDEVYGSLADNGFFYETSPLCPRSPYSASKAAGDHLVNAYHHTYGLNTTISRCSNNYGIYQNSEKLIPLMIGKILREEPLPIYGDGEQIRDWMSVDDHSTAIWKIICDGRIGEVYNIGGDNEWTNNSLVCLLCEIAAEIKGMADRTYYKRLITHTKDRPGHDRRYAVNCDKLKNELGWAQSVDFREGLERTFQWYAAAER